MYDLANQSFTLIIVTLFFPIYLSQRIAATPEEGERSWGFAVGASSLVVVILGPIVGALADFGGRKKAWLTRLAVGCSAFTVALAFVGQGDVGLAIGLFIVANMMFMAGENFLAAFLPEIADRDNLSRVSAIGWTMGYLGAMIVLPIAAVILIASGQSDTGFRIVFAFAGLWFLINAIPTMRILRERKAAETLPPGQTLWTIGFVRLWDSARSIGLYRSLAVFLLSFLVYSCGMSIIIAFAGVIAYKYLGAGALFLGFCWLLSFVAGVGSLTTGFIQHRVGYVATVAVSLVIWILTTVGAALLPPPPADPGNAPIPLLLWFVGLGVGLGLGLTGNASRTVVGVFTPAHKTAEFFGLWGLGYKLASVVAPPLYALISTSYGTPAGMAFTAAFFVIGLAILPFVNTPRGKGAVRLADRRFRASMLGKPPVPGPQNP